MMKCIGLTGIIALLLFCSRVDAVCQAADTADSSATKEAGVTSSGNADSAAAVALNRQPGADSAAGETPTPPPVITRGTTDGSGSPAIMSGNNGRDRDGTNNVQRASMNMVGSPTGGLELDDVSVDPDTEMQDRQEYSQDKQKSEQNPPDAR